MVSGQLSSGSPGALLCGEWAVVFGESRGHCCVVSGQLSSGSPGGLLCGEWAVVFGESRGIAVW